jgi:hypothetical protein
MEPSVKCLKMMSPLQIKSKMFKFTEENAHRLFGLAGFWVDALMPIGSMHEVSEVQARGSPQ